ncbi:hypothetical protein FPANT_2266 [Fusarium pseudoanthophilum]|uniref:Uncharacterized protein n=1 Tax=Fusarium pseudoanthophilum TaxID=48495 RepID=A0A8H5UWB8_9HYPO|nr:hypothetical protein FPANT_2266 [Fusarium pseudoanthophilum]
MDLDQEASGPSNPRGSGENGRSTSQQGALLPQQVSLEMIQRFTQEQEPFKDPPDPGDMVTEVHTNQDINWTQVGGTAIGNDLSIETGFVQQGPIITQPNIPLALGYRNSVAPIHNTPGRHSEEVSQLREADIVRVQPRRVRRHHHHVVTISHRVKEVIQMTPEEVVDPTDVAAIGLSGRDTKMIGLERGTRVSMEIGRYA